MQGLAGHTGLDSCLLDVGFSQMSSAEVDTCYNLIKGEIGNASFLSSQDNSFF